MDRMRQTRVLCKKETQQHSESTNLYEYNTIQYNILLLQSQTDRCESDIHNDMYDSIAGQQELSVVFCRGANE